tara:strand:- start:3532 stop:4863 length:1332 start_codon:yes stop_codon:yes gene_type:complete
MYNQSISKQHIIDPVFNKSNFRAEYRLESDTIYFSSLRLINLGIEGTKGDNEYNKLVGAYGVIKNIYLQDDNEVLDSLNEANRWLGFKMYNQENQVSMDINNAVAKNCLGSAMLGVGSGTTGQGAKIDEWKPRVSSTAQIGGAVNNSQAWLDLKLALPLLSSMESLDTRVFKKLKLVVEYSNDLDDYMIEADDTNSATLEAQLVVDEIIDPKEREAQAFSGGVSYKSIEHDLATIPALVVDSTISNLNPTPTQSTTLRIGGFNNKNVGKVVVMKNPNLVSNYKTGDNNHRGGKFASVCANKQVLNFRVNGATKIAGSGINRDNSRLSYLHDSWGMSSSYPFCNSTAYNEVQGTDRNIFIKDGNVDIGNLDFYGCAVNDRVLDFQIDYQREGVYSFTTAPVVKATDDAVTTASVYNAQYDMNIYAEVFKNISMNKDGTYSVNYI